MSRKKIKADSVEQLMEIVKAIQNGEEPDEALRRKEMESAPEADSPNLRSKKSGSVRNRSFEKTEDPEENAEEAAGEPEKEPGESVSAAVPEEEEEDEFDQLLDQDDGLEVREVLEQVREKAETALGVLNDIKQRVQESAAKRKEAREAAEEKEKSFSEEKTSAEEKSFSEKESPSEENESSDALPILESLLGSAENEPAEPIPDTPQKKEKTEISKKLTQWIAGVKETLAQKEIHRRELVMLAMGLCLTILIIALVVSGISSAITERAKSENVTADEGLTVTVEQQPEQWCSSYPVELKVRAQGTTVQNVTINGETYQQDENNCITVTATDYLLEAEIQTEEGTTLNARIEIPMIDSQAPVVNVEREQDTITVTAADGRSDVKQIYYAICREDDYLELPQYQLYSEPLIFESDTTYYFYAQDYAGNCSAPLVTTTETAGSMTLDQEELMLFPDETGYLNVEAVPSGALLNNLKFESADPEVVTVTGSGLVEAVGEGSTLVTVSADGVSSISCAVTVSSTRTVTLSAIGDCTLGTDETFNTTTSFDAYDAVNGHAYFLQNVKSILEADDVTFANLEGPLTTSTDKTTTGIYAFKGDPSYTEVLEDGSVEVVTLANNHANDYGSQGLEDTKENLKAAGIDYCVNDEICIREVNGIQMAFIGIYELNEGIECESRVRSTIEDAKQQGAQLVIVAFHWGTEKANYPDETQQSLAHTAIDCGADLVLGHHPHVLQGIETYNGKYIVYSLANFCFGGNSSPSDMDTIIFQQTFTVTQDGVLSDDQITVIPCSVSSVSGYNNYQPTPATGSEAERILQRLDEYSSQFGQTSFASGAADATE